MCHSMWAENDGESKPHMARLKLCVLHHCVYALCICTFLELAVDPVDFGLYVPHGHSLLAEDPPRPYCGGRSFTGTNSLGV